MKQAVWLLLVVLCSAVFLFADAKGTQMSGTICDNACVVRTGGLPACDPQCTEKSGSLVLVGDKGHVMTIVNQKMAMPHMGQHVKLMAVPTEKQREESIRIMEFYNEAP